MSRLSCARGLWSTLSAVRVLIVRLRLIGDVVFTTPVIRALRRTLPGAHLSYLVEPAAAPVVRHHPDLDEVILAPRTRGWQRIRDDVRLGRRLHRARYDVVLDLHSGPRASWLTWLSRAPRRIGFEVQGRQWMYTDVVSRPRDIRPRHSVENQWDLLAPLLPALRAADARRRSGDDDACPGGGRRPSTPGCARRPWDQATTWWSCTSARATRSGAGRCSLSSSWRIGSRQADANRRIILTSGPSEAAAAAEVVRLVRERRPESPEAVRTCGDMSLDELHALIGRARLYIGGDSGPLHVAATTRTPIVGLYGPTLPVRSATVARPAVLERGCRCRGPALPAVRTTRLRTWRLPVPDAHHR